MRLGEILIREGICTPEDVNDALKQQDYGDDRRIGAILIENGTINYRHLVIALGIQAETGTLQQKLSA